MGVDEFPKESEDIFPEDEFPCEGEESNTFSPKTSSPAKTNSPAKRKTKTLPPKTDSPVTTNSPAKPNSPAKTKTKTFPLKTNFLAKTKDEQTFSPKTRGCCKGRGALVRRERGGIERRGEVLYNEKARGSYERRDRNESGGAVQGKRRHNVSSRRHVSSGQDRECVVSHQSLRQDASSGDASSECVVSRHVSSGKVNPSLAHMTFPSLAHICAHPLTCAHAHILDCHLRRYYPHTEPYKTMGYNFYLNLPPLCPTKQWPTC